MKPRVSYSILSEQSEFLKHTVTKYILTLNEKAGVYPDRSLFGSFILVSDDEHPDGTRKFVISHKDRGDGFKILNLDEDPLPVLYEVLGIESKEYKLFVRNKVYSNRKTTRESLYYYMVLLRDCIKEDGTLNTTKANLIVDNYKYQSRSSTFDKYRSLNNYVTRPNEESLFELIKVFSDDPSSAKRFRSIAYTIKTVLEGNVPSYIESRISFSTDHSAVMQYLILASEVALFEDMDTFVSNLISKLVS